MISSMLSDGQKYGGLVFDEIEMQSDLCFIK
jgi:hypothetical protein